MLMSSTSRRVRTGILKASFAACLMLLAGWGSPSVQAQSLYADPIARQAGDILTIVLAEETSAQRESRYTDASSASQGGEASVGSPTLSGRFAADTQFNQEAASRNRTVQSELLRGTVTARVTEVDPGGNLIIEGERHLNVNGVTHIMRITGTVRALDVQANNTVLSYQVADAHVDYRQDGRVRRLLGTGTLTKIGAVAILGAALFFGAQ